MYIRRCHAVQGIAAAAADTDHLDIYIGIKRIFIDKISHLNISSYKNFCGTLYIFRIVRLPHIRIPSLEIHLLF